MGQKTNPIGNRLGYIRGWDSNWYADKEYAANVIEDEKLRQYLGTRIEKGGIARIIIERTLKRVTLTIHTSRPGIIIGKGGREIEQIRQELHRLTKKDIQINIIEIRKPELDANIVAESIAKQIEARINYRRAIKTSIASTMRASAEGIKVRISGRLNGSDMSRTEEYKEGRTPLHTFRADIDYAHKEAHTVYGRIGIKVWLCKGEVLGKRDLNPNAGLATKGNDRRGGGGGGRDRDRGGRGGRDRGGRGGNRR